MPLPDTYRLRYRRGNGVHPVSPRPPSTRNQSPAAPNTNAKNKITRAQRQIRTTSNTSHWPCTVRPLFSPVKSKPLAHKQHPSLHHSIICGSQSRGAPTSTQPLTQRHVADSNGLPPVDTYILRYRRGNGVHPVSPRPPSTRKEPPRCNNTGNGRQKRGTNKNKSKPHHPSTRISGTYKHAYLPRTHNEAPAGHNHPSHTTSSPLPLRTPCAQ